MSDLLQEIYSYLEDDKMPSLDEILDLRMQKLNISQRTSSDVLGVERKSLQRILNKDHQKIDILTLLKIGYFLNTNIEQLIKICVSNMTPEELHELEQVRKSTFILENFDLDGLKEMGLITDKSDFGAIENKILNFFGIDSIYNYQRELGIMLFSKTKKSFNDKMREFWLKSIESAFVSIANPYEYKPELLEKLIPRISAYSKNEKNGLLTVIRALYMMGITVLVQPYPKNTQIKGASFLIKKKPCIVLTDYNKRYDTLWFSLIHELSHILHDYDILQSIYHLSGDNDLFLIEDNANKFAQNVLFSEEKAQYIYKLIHIPALVEEFANKCNIHSSIIYGFYIYQNPEENMKYRKLIAKSSVALQAIQEHHLFEFENIEEGIKQMKEKIFINL